MTDFLEVIRNLQNELEESKDEIKRKDKQIQTVKKTNKIQQAHAEMLRKKIQDLESKRSSVQVQDDSFKVQELNNLIDKLNNEIEQLEIDNKSLKKERDSQQTLLKKLESEAKNEAQKNRLIRQKLANQIEQLETENKGLKKEREANQVLLKKLEGETKSETEKNRIQKLKLANEIKENQKKSNISEKENPQYQKKISDYEKRNSQLENELSKAKRLIVELKQSANNQIRSSEVVKSQNLAEYEDRFGGQSIKALQFQSDFEKIDFYDSVPLSESLSEDVGVPTTHAKLFKILETYIMRLMPSEKIRFMNLIIANVEGKLQQAHESVGLLRME